MQANKAAKTKSLIRLRVFAAPCRETIVTTFHRTEAARMQPSSIPNSIKILSACNLFSAKRERQAEESVHTLRVVPEEHIVCTDKQRAQLQSQTD